MRWKELIIGGFITLGVTVVGGLVVYWSTFQRKSENLTYPIIKEASFEGSNTILSIGGVSFSNIGIEPADDITAEIEISWGSILEFSIADEVKARISKIVMSEDNKKLTLELENMLPTEIISVTYLLSRNSKVEFAIRSSRLIGQHGRFIKFKTKVGGDSSNK